MKRVLSRRSLFIRALPIPVLHNISEAGSSVPH